jgi:flagellar biogenesis protein FliO
MEGPQHSVLTGKSQKWLPLGVIGVVASLAGLVLPQFLPSTTPSPNAGDSATAAIKSDKTDWTYTPTAWPEPPNHSVVFLRLGLGTLAVLGLCAATLWTCKRWLRAGPFEAAPGAQLRRIESLALGNRCVVHLVHLANRPVLVGTDAGGIKTIVPLPDSFEQTLLQTQEAGAAQP